MRIEYNQSMHNRNAIEKKIEEVAQRIAIKFQPEQIILFGSFAWGNPTEDSDVDLFIIKSTASSTRDMSREISGFVFPRPFPLDIIVYKPEQVKQRKESGDFFMRDIFSKGRILYEKQQS